MHAGEPAGFDDLARSLASGKKEKQRRALRLDLRRAAGADAGRRHLPAGTAGPRPGLVVTDDEVLDAMEVAFREFKLVVEPGGAVALAAASPASSRSRGRTVAVDLLRRQRRPRDLRPGARAPRRMKFTRRDRRDVRFFLWFSLSACLIQSKGAGHLQQGRGRVQGS